MNCAAARQSNPVSGARHRQSQHGFTLLEMLVVLAIMGVMLTLIMPGLGIRDDAARRRETDAAFEAIRMAILGPRGQTGPEGRLLIGGYVGDMGELPKLYILDHWDKGVRCWEASDPVSIAGPYDYDGGFSDDRDVYAQPVGLWRDDVPVKDKSSEEISFPDKWRGPYIKPPNDPYPDDNMFERGRSTDEDMLFLLRESNGRLHDGWGRSFIVLTEDELTENDAPRSLVFISAGPDGDFALDEDPKGLNADNLIYYITPAEYEDEVYKTAETWARLQALRAAMVPALRTATGGQAAPTGYAADVGGLESLFGSLVFHGNRFYVCKRDHGDSREPGTGSGNDYWEKLDDSGIARTDVPAIPDWVSGVQYRQPRPNLLFSNADHVRDSGGKVRQCAAPEGAFCEELSTDVWKPVGNVGFPIISLNATSFGTVKNIEWPEYEEYESSFSSYYRGSNVIPAWAVNGTNQPALGYGWRGGYMASRNGPPLWHDAWGKPLIVGLDGAGTIRLSSSTAKEIQLTIYRHEYEVPLQVAVKVSEVINPVQGQSRVDVWAPLNGKLHVWQSGVNGTVPGSQGVFRFGRTAGDGVGALQPIKMVTAEKAFFEESSLGAEYLEPGERYVPVGRVYVEYRQKDFKDYGGGVGEYASPHPSLTVNGDSKHGPGGCQGLWQLYPMGGDGYELCAD